jgi:signal transduction histidine kinase
MRTGRSLLFPKREIDEFSRSVVDVEHARLAVALGSESALVVSIVARDRVLGAMTLCSAIPGRFDHDDVALVEELGRRAGMAIENAQLYAQVQNAVHMRDEFLSVASHELNTPMTALRLALQSMVNMRSRNELDANALMMRAQMAERQSQRLARLISELLDVTRIERHAITLALQPVELGALIQDMIGRYQAELSRTGCVVSLTCQEPVTGRWDPSRVEQVVLNLLSNAAKFGAGKPIEIRVEKVVDCARLTVTDHGIGIDPAQQPLIFQRFARAVPTQHYGGLGLGLYVCRALVESHGGTIRVESQPGQGATFIVELPLSNPREENQAHEPPLLPEVG